MPIFSTLLSVKRGIYTFRCALALLAITGVAQVVAWAMLSGPGWVKNGSGKANGPSSPAATLSDANLAALTQDVTSTPSPQIPLLTPPSSLEPVTPLTREDFILRTALEAVLVARSSRRAGDMDMALAKLREAQALAPQNAEVLAELATTFELMGQDEKARAHWRLVQSLGPRTAGMYYRMAEDKLNAGLGRVPVGELEEALLSDALLASIRQRASLQIVSHQLVRGQLEFPETAPEDDTETDPAADAEETSDAQAEEEPEETEEGTTDAENAEAESEDAENANTDEEEEEVETSAEASTGQSLTDATLQAVLRLAVQGKSQGAPIISSAVRIQVYFYDVVNNQHVMLTNAFVASEWKTNSDEWVPFEPQVLKVSYEQDDLTLGEEGQEEERSLLGYVVRLYYDGELQDVAAEPNRLLEMYPPPTRLQSESEL
ncbi:MAG: tetratricopeptide repeat protein [Verrucomicrobiales bacterium]